MTWNSSRIRRSGRHQRYCPGHGFQAVACSSAFRFDAFLKPTRSVIRRVETSGFAPEGHSVTFQSPPPQRVATPPILRTHPRSHAAGLQSAAQTNNNGILQHAVRIGTPHDPGGQVPSESRPSVFGTTVMYAGMRSEVTRMKGAQSPGQVLDQEVGKLRQSGTRLLANPQ